MSVYLEIVTSPNCAHSPKAVKLAQKLLKKMHGVNFQEVSMITQWGMQKAQEYGVSATPAIVVNGRIAFVGVPEAGKFKKMIDDEIKKESEQNSYFF